MKVVMTLLVRDEQDIVAANLEHHLDRGVDFVIVTDNRSVDRTPEILAAYERAGVVRVITEEADDYNQTAWVTRMARLAATDHGADWVINNDADEFWWPDEGDLRSALASVPPELDVVTAHRHNLVADPDAAGPFHERMILRDTRSTNPLGGPLGPKACHRAHPEVVVRQGNHELEWPGMGGSLDDGRIEILHFPVRTPEQFAGKIAKGGAAYARNTELPAETGLTWRTLHARQQAGELDEVLGELIPGGSRIAEQLASGRLVRDTRLRDHLRALAPRSVVPDAIPVAR